jgi:hypothetical protein
MSQASARLPRVHIHPSGPQTADPKSVVQVMPPDVKVPQHWGGYGPPQVLEPVELGPVDSLVPVADSLGPVVDSLVVDSLGPVVDSLDSLLWVDDDELRPVDAALPLEEDVLPLDDALPFDEDVLA